MAPIAFTDLMTNHQAYDHLLNDFPGIKGHFQDYLRTGFYPFYRENPLSYHEKLLDIIDKTIYEDIANFYSFKTANLHQFRKILNFLASIPPGTITVHSLGKNLSIDDKTVMNYLTSLNETGLINVVYPKESGNVGLRRPEKIFLNNTNLQYAIEANLASDIHIGTIRELFFIQAITQAGHAVFHSKQWDYTVLDYTFEVGSKNKTAKQIQNIERAFLVKDDILVSRKREIPLILFGLLY